MIDEDFFDQEVEKEAKDGWMVTFSDLMSLLLCFFVLILSMAEVDIIRYKQLADSMASAFGVQQDMQLESIPKGTSVVSTEFRPGIPDETIVEAIQQVTKDQDRNSLRIGNLDCRKRMRKIFVTRCLPTTRLWRSSKKPNSMLRCCADCSSRR